MWDITTLRQTRHGRQLSLNFWTQRHSWTSRADHCNSIGRNFQATPRSTSWEKFKHSWDSGNRVIEKEELFSCRCSTTLNWILDQRQSANMFRKCNRCYRIREAIQVRSLVCLWTWTGKSMVSHVPRTDQTEHGIILLGTWHWHLKKLHIQYFNVLSHFWKEISSPRTVSRPFTFRVRFKPSFLALFWQAIN